MTTPSQDHDGNRTAWSLLRGEERMAREDEERRELLNRRIAAEKDAKARGNTLCEDCGAEEPVSTGRRRTCARCAGARVIKGAGR